MLNSRKHEFTLVLKFLREKISHKLHFKLNVRLSLNIIGEPHIVFFIFGPKIPTDSMILKSSFSREVFTWPF